VFLLRRDPAEPKSYAAIGGFHIANESTNATKVAILIS
jgi:hypothetical protein